MSGSMNKVFLIGRLGQDPEIRSMSAGDKVANLSIATSDSWKDKNTGQKNEKTEWHRIVLYGDGLVGVCEKYLHKGAQILIEGKLQTRKWQDQQGQDRYTTEIVVSGYGGRMVMLGNNSSEYSQNTPYYNQSNAQNSDLPDEFDDDIPF